jgi:cell wall-associated NlpC family hydrolase
LPYAVQGMAVAAVPTVPAGHLRRFAIVVIAVSLAVAFVAIDGHATAFGQQLVGGESAFVAAPADNSNIDAPATRSPRAHSTGRESNDRQGRVDRATTTHARPTGHAEAHRIVAIASHQLGAKFRMGATGMHYFDCSGLIYRVYQQAGLLNKIGGSRRLAAGYYSWFKQRGLASRSNPQVGDLAIWTENGRIVHSGIYVGHGRVISALINPWGVRKTHVNSLHVHFLAYLHVRLDR